MISDPLPPRQATIAMAATSRSDGSYIDWAAILAGGVLALAISVLLISFGAGLGLSLTSPYRGEGVSAAWVAIAAGIWFAWVMVSGFGAGGYLAGRMRRRAGDATAAEVEARDAMHGLMVWATGLVAGAVLAAMGVGGLMTAGSAAVGKGIDVATEAASSDYFANLMLRGAILDPAVQPTDGTAPTPTQAAATVDPAVQSQIAAILVRNAASAEMSGRDSSYLAQVVAANTDLNPTEARARVDEVNAEIAKARADALAAVEKARVAAVVFGFIAAATLLIGAIAAFFAAAAGGRHRDAGLGFDLVAVAQR